LEHNPAADRHLFEITRAEGKPAVENLFDGDSERTRTRRRI
jgi:hypothetical protein